MTSANYIIPSIQMSGESLDYVIVNKTKIVPQTGNIESIVQKKSNGFTMEHTSKFQFEIRLKSKSIVSLIQVKPMLGESITIDLFGEKSTVIDTRVEHNIKLFEPMIVLFNESKERKIPTAKLRIELSNGSKDGGVGLFYLLVKGQVVEEKEKHKTVSKQHSEDKFFKDSKQSVHRLPVASRIKDDVFSNRKKTRDVKDDKKIEAKIKQMDQDYEMQRVIELSKKQAENDKQTGNHQPQKSHHKEETSRRLQVAPREYTKVDYEKHKIIFQYVNSTWIEAQRKAQIEKGVKDSERLSNAIQVRHFHNKTVCVDVTPAAKRYELQRFCEQMGAKVKSDPCESCLLIANKVDTQKVAKGKRMKYVKILKPDFITDCKRYDAYLDEKDYFHKR